MGVVFQTGAQGNAGANAVTPPVDTTGATFFVANVSFVGTYTSFVDSKSNVWQIIAPTGQNSSAPHRVAYCIAPITGTGHFFTGAGFGMAISVTGFDFPTPVYLADLVSTGNGTNTVSTAALTPALGTVVVSMFTTNNNSGVPDAMVNAAFTKLDNQAARAGSNVGSAIAWAMGTGVPLGATWTQPANSAITASIMSFTTTAIVAVIPGTSVEQYSNGAQSPLSVDATATQTSFSVVDGSVYPQGTFRVKLGGELAWVGGVVGNILHSVVRGIENTVAATHVIGTPVVQGLTEGSLRMLGLPGRPSSLGKVPTWDMFSGVNTSGCSFVEDGAGLALVAPARGSGFNLIGHYMNVPTPPYQVTAAFEMCAPHKSYLGYGLSWRSSGGAIASIDCVGIDGETHELSVRKFNSATSYNSGYLFMKTMGPVRWMRLTDDGTNRKVLFSADGSRWIELWSVARTDFLTPTQIGWQCFNENISGTTFGAVLRLLSWDVASQYVAPTIPYLINVGSGNGALTLNMTGAKLLVAQLSCDGSPTIVDSLSNTWLTMGAQALGGATKGQLYYVINPVVGAGQVFTGGGGSFLSYGVAGFGAIHANPVDQAAQAKAFIQNLAVGPITPSLPNSLVIVGVGSRDNGSWSGITEGYTNLWAIPNGALYGTAMWWKTLGAVATNPTLTFTATTNQGAEIRSFKPV